MYRSKIVKKRTKNRQTLLRNLNKGKARKEARCHFQIIPHPDKFPLKSQIHRLYADVVLLEQNETLAMEVSLFNNFKIYKHAHVFETLGQKILKIQVEEKDDAVVDWKSVHEKLVSSESEAIRQWAEPVKVFCERYEAVLRELQKNQEEISNEKHEFLLKINEETEKVRRNIIKTYPCIELKSQLKDGHIQTTEILFSEKYLKEFGYSVDGFAATVLQEGIPEMTSLSSTGPIAVAKLRLDKYLTTDPNGYQTPDCDSMIVMKNGYNKKLKLRIYYRACYEKGIPGFTFIGAIIARQKPLLGIPKVMKAFRVSSEFVEYMSNREKEVAQFLSMYYNERTDKKYTNLDKICTVREIEDLENL